MLPNLDVTSTTMNIVLLLVIFGAVFYLLKSKKTDKDEEK
jgi:hypothetical protein